MNIQKCYDAYCGKDNLSCLLDCNSMLTNILLLKDIHNKISKFEKVLDSNDDNIVRNLNDNFQNQFLKLCNDYIADYEKIIDNKCGENGSK